MLYRLKGSTVSEFLHTAISVDINAGVDIEPPLPLHHDDHSAETVSQLVFGPLCSWRSKELTRSVRHIHCNANPGVAAQDKGSPARDLHFLRAIRHKSLNFIAGIESNMNALPREPVLEFVQLIAPATFSFCAPGEIAIGNKLGGIAPGYSSDQLLDYVRSSPHAPSTGSFTPVRYVHSYSRHHAGSHAQRNILWTGTGAPLSLDQLTDNLFCMCLQSVESALLESANHHQGSVLARVKTALGNQVEILVPRNATVDIIYQAWSQAAMCTGVNPVVRVVSGGKQAMPHVTLGQLATLDKCTLHILFPLAGGGSARSCSIEGVAQLRDSWEVRAPHGRGMTIVRLHRVPRTLLFRPDIEGVLPPGISSDSLSSARTNIVPGQEPHTFTDDWRRADVNASVSWLWTGRTEFQLRPTPIPPSRAPYADDPPQDPESNEDMGSGDSGFHVEFGESAESASSISLSTILQAPDPGLGILF